MDAPANAPPALDDACTDSVIAIATYLFNRARGPPVPPPLAVTASVSAQTSIDAARLVESAESVLSDVLALHNQFPILTKDLFGIPPVPDPASLGPLLLQIAGVALRQSTRLIAAVCAAAEALGETFVHDLDNELATFLRLNDFPVALDPVEQHLCIPPAAQLLIRYLLAKAPVHEIPPACQDMYGFLATHSFVHEGVLTPVPTWEAYRKLASVAERTGASISARRVVVHLVAALGHISAPGVSTSSVPGWNTPCRTCGCSGCRPPPEAAPCRSTCSRTPSSWLRPNAATRTPSHPPRSRACPTASTATWGPLPLSPRPSARPRTHP